MIELMDMVNLSGKMHGFGEYKYSNGKIYKGFFSQGQKDNDKMKKYEIWKQSGYGISTGYPFQSSLGLNNNQTQIQEDNMIRQNSKVDSNGQLPDGMKPLSVKSGSNNMN